jgi:hypothetical protein
MLFYSPIRVPVMQSERRGNKGFRTLSPRNTSTNTFVFVDSQICEGIFHNAFYTWWIVWNGTVQLGYCLHLRSRVLFVLLEVTVIRFTWALSADNSLSQRHLKSRNVYDLVVCTHSWMSDKDLHHGVLPFLRWWYSNLRES